MHTHMHMNAHARMHMHVKHANHAKHGCLHVGGHLQFLYMYTCVYVRVLVCVCVCVCGGTPPMLPDAPDTPHPPAPPPRAEKTQIGRITITLELIEIIQFCLKIYDPWTLLHTYRLGLMCRWGGVLSQMALLCFGPKKVHLFHSCEPLIKNFPVFALDTIRPYLDWALRGFLTS